MDYEGQNAQRMVYFIQFRDEAADQLHKEKICWKKGTLGGRTIPNALGTFFDDLEDLGMLGYGSRHGRSLKVMCHLCARTRDVS